MAGKVIELEVSAGADSEASRTIRLPPGTHRYTIATAARALRYPGNGGFPFSLLVKGKGAGEVAVRGGSRLVLRRGECEGARYTARLEGAGR